MTTTIARNTFLQRLVGAAALDTAIYEEVEADPGATKQAFAVVLLSSLAAGVGVRGFGEQPLANLVFVSFLALIAWGAWALLTFQIGGRLMRSPETHVDVGELLRTLGFSATPGLLLVLGAMPAVTVPVFAVTSVWLLIAMIVAVRQALDYTSTAKAIAVCVFGWVLATVISVVIGLAFASTVS